MYKSCYTLWIVTYSDLSPKTFKMIWLLTRNIYISLKVQIISPFSQMWMCLIYDNWDLFFAMHLTAQSKLLFIYRLNITTLCFPPVFMNAKYHTHTTYYHLYTVFRNLFSSCITLTALIFLVLIIGNVKLLILHLFPSRIYYQLIQYKYCFLLLCPICWQRSWFLSRICTIIISLISWYSIYS